MKKLRITLIATLLVLSLISSSFGETVKNETVYVNLDYDGKVKDITIVNRLSGSPVADTFTDYGKYFNLEVLTGGVQPSIKSDSLTWPSELLKNSDIYYRATVDEKLPLDISINYYLDGNQINANELLGKSGKFKIRVSIKNSKLTSQIQIPLDLDVFKDIKAEGAVNTVVGKTMTVTFNHLPMGDEEFIVEANATDISLEPITIASTPTKISLPENVKNGVTQLSDGIDELSDATMEVKKGSDELASGTKKLRGGTQSLANGMTSLLDGMKRAVLGGDEIKKGLMDFNSGLGSLNTNMKSAVDGIQEMSGGLNRLKNEGSELKQGIDGLSSGLKKASDGAEALDMGVYQMQVGLEQLAPLAQGLLQDPNTPPHIKQLAQAVLGQIEGVAKLKTGTYELKQGISEISKAGPQLSGGFTQYQGAVTQVADGMNELSTKLSPLPNGIKEMANGHEALVGGFDSFLGGIKEVEGGLAKSTNGAKAIPSQVDRIVNGQYEISNGLQKINDDGFNKIKDNLDTFDVLDEDSEENVITSFANNDKNKSSSVQFIIRTPELRKDEKSTQPPILNEEDNRNVWQRFLDLFR